MEGTKPKGIVGIKKVQEEQRMDASHRKVEATKEITESGHPSVSLSNAEKWSPTENQHSFFVIVSFCFFPL